MLHYISVHCFKIASVLYYFYPTFDNLVRGIQLLKMLIDILSFNVLYRGRILCCNTSYKKKNYVVTASYTEKRKSKF